MADYKFVVLTNPVEGREDEYNAWYDDQHLNDVLKAPGFWRAQRFENADPLSDAPPRYKYLAIYDFESDDLARTFETFFTLAGTDQMPISDAMDKDVSPIVYRVRGPAREKPKPGGK